MTKLPINRADEQQGERVRDDGTGYVLARRKDTYTITIGLSFVDREKIPRT